MHRSTQHEPNVVDESNESLNDSHFLEDLFWRHSVGSGEKEERNGVAEPRCVGVEVIAGKGIGLGLPGSGKG